MNIWNQSGDFLVVLTMNKADAINKAKEYSDGSEFGGEVALNVAHKQFNLDKEQLESWGSCDEEPVKRLVKRRVKHVATVYAFVTKETGDNCKLVPKSRRTENEPSNKICRNA